jgi:NodT family efflux transporter outer membrane factor (OMF) lipoprotein
MFDLHFICLGFHSPSNNTARNAAAAAPGRSRERLSRQARTGVLVLAAALGGCASTAGIAPQSALNRAERLAASASLAQNQLSPSAWPESDWWKRFGDSQLDRLMDEALGGSPTLRIAQARLRKALAASQASAASLYPHADADAQVTRERLSEHGMVPPQFAGSWVSELRLQATLDYDFDLWGGNRAAYEAALGRAAAAEVDAFAARLALSTNVAQAYARLALAFRQRDVAEKTLAERESFYRLTKERYDAGVDSNLPVKQAQARLPAIRGEIARWDEEIGLARNQLAALLGQGPDRGLSIARPALYAAPLAIPSRIPADLIGRRPDVVAQRWRVEAARKDIDTARARFYPNVNLKAFIGLQSIGLPAFVQAGSGILGIAPAVSLPVFDAGKLRAELGGTTADYDLAVEQYNQTLVSALREVVDQLASWRSLEERKHEQALAQTTAQEAYDLARMRYREGVGNYLDVLTAESQLLQQESLEADLAMRGIGLSIALARALGGGFGNDDTDPAAHGSRAPESTAQRAMEKSDGRTE